MEKEKAVVFGIGLNYKYASNLILSKFNIIGLIDNDKSKQGKIIGGLDVKSPEFLLTKPGQYYDKIIIIPYETKFEMFNQLLNMGIPFDKIDMCYFNGSVYIPQKQIINGKLVLSTKGIRLIIENEYDAMLFGEMVSDLYEMGLNDNSRYVVVNIGGNVADTALYFASFENIAKIYSYEPFKNIFNKGLENLKLNPNLLKKIEYNNFAISDRNEELFLEDSDAFSASIVNSKKGSSKIIVKDVAEIFNDIFSKHSDEIFLEMDCEGSEYEILSKLESENMLEKISVIAMECHYNNDASEKKEFLKKILKRNGFMFKLITGLTTDMLYGFNCSQRR